MRQKHRSGFLSTAVRHTISAGPARLTNPVRRSGFAPLRYAAAAGRAMPARESALKRLHRRPSRATFVVPLRFVLCAGALWAAAGLPVLAQGLGSSAAHFKVNRIETSTHFNADAGNVEDYLIEREALSEQGAQIVGKWVFQYRRGLQRHEIIEAYTLKADGRHVPVGADAVQVQRGVAGAGVAVSAPDAEIVLVTFPDVRPSDRTVLRAKLSTSAPFLPGWAQHGERLAPGVTFDKVVAHVEAPSALTLNVVAHGFSLSRGRSGENNTWDLAASSVARSRKQRWAPKTAWRGNTSPTSRVLSAHLRLRVMRSRSSKHPLTL